MTIVWCGHGWIFSLVSNDFCSISAKVFGISGGFQLATVSWPLNGRPNIVSYCSATKKQRKFLLFKLMAKDTQDLSVKMLNPKSGKAQKSPWALKGPKLSQSPISKSQRPYFIPAWSEARKYRARCTPKTSQGLKMMYFPICSLCGSGSQTTKSQRPEIVPKPEAQKSLARCTPHSFRFLRCRKWCIFLSVVSVALAPKHNSTWVASGISSFNSLLPLI